MTKKLIYLLGILYIVSASSCVRERDTDTTLAAELAMHEFLFLDAASLADDAATKKTGENLSNYKTRGYCATITHDEINRQIIIDFGLVNCMCNDGRNRHGKIWVDYTGNYEDSGSIHSITFDNYFVNDHQVFGSNVVENKGKNSLGQTWFTSNIDGKVLQPLVVDTLYYHANREIAWTEGESTPVWGDDVYEITGTGSGKNALKTFYAMTITEPLIKKVVQCRFYSKGKIEMQPQGKALRTIDFGDGTCDKDATVTFNNKVFHISLW